MMLIPHPAAFVQLQGTKWVPYPSSLQKPGAINNFLFLYLPFLGRRGDLEQRERAWLRIVLLEQPRGASGALHPVLIQDWDVSRRGRRGSPLPFHSVLFSSHSWFPFVFQVPHLLWRRLCVLREGVGAVPGLQAVWVIPALYRLWFGALGEPGSKKRVCSFWCWAWRHLKSCFYCQDGVRMPHHQHSSPWDHPLIDLSKNAPGIS